MTEVDGAVYFLVFQARRPGLFEAQPLCLRRYPRRPTVDPRGAFAVHSPAPRPTGRRPGRLLLDLTHPASQQ